MGETWGAFQMLGSVQESCSLAMFIADRRILSRGNTLCIQHTLEYLGVANTS